MNSFDVCRLKGIVFTATARTDVVLIDRPRAEPLTALRDEPRCLPRHSRGLERLAGGPPPP